MILTITMNPSIDISYPLDSLNLDTVNRVSETLKTPGGKGLNVTRVLAQLGDSVLASGLLGGKTGEFLEEKLDKLGIRHSFYKISGETRNCIAILHDGHQTEILEKGPKITDSEEEGFLEHFKEILAQADVVAISGSLPDGLAPDYYGKMIALAKSVHKKVVLDCSGQALLETLKAAHKPDVIKPNKEELAQLLGIEITDSRDALKAALQDELFAGIEWIIVSLGADGAFAKHGKRFYRVSIPKIDVVNPVGSGDSTVAGIASALAYKESDLDLLTKANVLGMLNAQEKLTGHVNMDHYQNLYHQIQVREV